MSSMRARLLWFLIPPVVALGGVSAWVLEDPGGVPGHSDAAVNRALRDLQDGDRTQMPVSATGASLENTAFAAHLAASLGVPWPAPEDLPAPEDDDPDMVIWNSYYRSLATGAGVEQPSRLTVLQQPDGTFVEPPEELRARDRPYVLVTTWAALSAGAPVHDALLATLYSELADCQHREYVLAHVAEAITVAEGSEQTSRRLLEECARIRGTAGAPVALPTNEEELLDLVGRAMVLGRLDWPAPSEAEAYRTALGAAPWFWQDPWWAHQSFSGFTAAGGPADEYLPTLDRWRPYLDHGQMPLLAAVQPGVELDVFATLAAKSSPGDWTSASPATVHAEVRRAVESGQEWSDVDWAMWGRWAYEAGAQLDEEDSRRVLDASRRCGAEAPGPGTIRSLWLCRTTYRVLGGEGGWPTVPDGFGIDLPAPTAVEALLLLDVEAEARQVEELVHGVAQQRDRMPTHTLAQALLLADRVGLGGSDSDEVLVELSNRRAEDGALYAADASAMTPDLYATYWVVLADSAHR